MNLPFKFDALRQGHQRDKSGLFESSEFFTPAGDEKLRSVSRWQGRTIGISSLGSSGESAHQKFDFGRMVSRRKRNLVINPGKCPNQLQPNVLKHFILPRRFFHNIWEMEK